MKPLELALVLAGLVGVGCGQSKAAPPEVAVQAAQNESAPAAPPAAIPAPAAQPLAATVRAAAATPSPEVTGAPMPAEAPASLAPASKAAAKASTSTSPRVHSKKAAHVRKGGGDDITSF